MKLKIIKRFNFGFKFICEDEAERFFNVISKFSLLDDINYESTCGLQNMDIFNDKMYSPLTQIEYAANRIIATDLDIDGW